MIKQLLGLSGQPAPQALLTDRYFYTRHMATVIDVSRDPLALDCSQVFVTAFLETPTHFRLFYCGQSAHSIVYPPDGVTYENTDQVFIADHLKNDALTTGWVKFPDVNGYPKPIVKKRGGSALDRDQVWLRGIISEGTTHHGYFIAHHTANGFKMLYGDSVDYGENWTRDTTVLLDDTGGPGGSVVIVKAVKVASTYYIFYNYTDPNVTGFQIASSSSPDTGFTKIRTNVLASHNLGYLAFVTYTSPYYYVWTGREFTTGSGLGPSKKLYLYRTTDLTTWENLGVQIERRGAMELGCGPEFALFPKPSGGFAMIHNYAKQSIEFEGFSGEQFTGVKCSELNRSDAPIANRPCVFSYPSFVQRHYPLGSEDYLNGRFYENVQDEKGTLTNTTTGLPVTPVWSELLNFLVLDGASVITFPGISINGGHFGFKFRVEIKLTGTHILLEIGDDVLFTIENGGFAHLQLSSDGLGYEKDWITNVPISKPPGITYVDDHIWVGFIKTPSGIIIFQDFIPFEESEITKTVDDALASVNNSQSEIFIGRNADLELRSASILIEPTEANFIEIDI